MATIQFSLDIAVLKAATDIVQRLQAHGHEAYWVGGCVRDLVMGAIPGEVDIATSATPDAVQDIFSNTVAVGEQFGVVLVIQEGRRFEVATFRTDAAYSDGRHPDAVRYSTSAKEDSRRRDFTINALFYDPTSRTLLDFHEGQEDLRRKCIRAIGDPHERFEEDRLRLLRAVRFAVRFGFQIEPRTRQAVRQLAAKIQQVSAERVRDELTRILTEGHSREGFRWLDELGLLHQVLPELETLKGVEQPAEFHPEGDVWVHTMLLLKWMDQKRRRMSGPHMSSIDYPGPALAWGALLHDIGKPPTFERAPDRIRFNGHMEVGARIARQIGRRLRMSNEDIDVIAALVLDHLKFKDVFSMRPATLKRFVRRDHFEDHLELHRLDCLASHGKLDAYEFASKFVASLRPDEIRPKPLLDGNDLIDLGFKPGPQFKKILAALEDAQLDNQIQDRESAVAFLEAHFPR